MDLHALRHPGQTFADGQLDCSVRVQTPVGAQQAPIGVPVITSAAAGAGVAVQEDGNGLLQRDPTDDAELAALLNRALVPGVLERWSAAAAASVALYTWPRVMERFEAALLEHATRRQGNDPL